MRTSPLRSCAQCSSHSSPVDVDKEKRSASVRQQRAHARRGSPRLAPVRRLSLSRVMRLSLCQVFSGAEVERAGPMSAIARCSDPRRSEGTEDARTLDRRNSFALAPAFYHADAEAQHPPCTTHPQPVKQNADERAKTLRTHRLRRNPLPAGLPSHRTDDRRRLATL